jgi:hypothetical protein
LKPSTAPRWRRAGKVGENLILLSVACILSKAVSKHFSKEPPNCLNAVIASPLGHGKPHTLSVIASHIVAWQSSPDRGAGCSNDAMGCPMVSLDCRVRTSSLLAMTESKIQPMFSRMRTNAELTASYWPRSWRALTSASLRIRS